MKHPHPQRTGGTGGTQRRALFGLVCLVFLTTLAAYGNGGF